MTTKPPRKAFGPFRGRQGHRRKKFISDFIRRYLCVDISVLSAEWEKLFIHYECNEGSLQAVKKTKALYDLSLRKCVGVQTTPIPFTKTNKEGWPLVLKAFIPYLTGSTNSKRAALTVLQFYKLQIVKSGYSLESITNPYGGQTEPGWLKDFDNALEQMFPSKLQRSRALDLSPGFHISAANGPNGPSLGTAFVDREAIRNTELEEVINNLSMQTDHEQLVDLLLTTWEPCEVMHTNGREPCHSRLRIKYESGGKARVFAICDFFTQSALKSIHKYFMKWLKNNECDGTDDHFLASQEVRKWTSDPSCPLWSWDLTTATDRFPVFLQERVVSHVLGPRIAKDWKKLIADRDFTGPEGERVRFATGQPLGALSSWAVFAVTHHVIVQTAANIAYKSKRPRRFKRYRLIGDDITIARNLRVATAYSSILKDLDVRISYFKSVLPEQCSERKNVAELAKRLFCNGEEITPVPPDAILEALNNPFGYKNLIESAWNRGYRSAGSPYTVQSAHLTKDEWAALSFPFRNRLPLFKGLESIISGWDFKEPKAGLHPGWFTWAEYPADKLQDSVKSYLLAELEAARVRTKEIADSIQHPIFMGNADIETPKSLIPYPKGGDWKPGTARCHTDIIIKTIDEVRLEVNDVIEELYYQDLPNLDLYRFIGRMHRLFEPELLIKGRNAASDEKAQTRTVLSKITKYCRRFTDKS